MFIRNNIFNGNQQDKCIREILLNEERAGEGRDVTLQCSISSIKESALPCSYMVSLKCTLFLSLKHIAENARTKIIADLLEVI